MKLLFITSRFPYPLEKGDKLRVFYQLKTLSQYFEVYLFALSESEISDNDLNMVKPYCKEIHKVKHSRSSSIRSIVKGGLSSVPIQTRYFYSPEFESLLQAKIKEINPDHIHFHLIRTTEYLKSHQKEATLDFMDSFSMGLSGFIDKVPLYKRWFYTLEGRLVKNYERDTVRRFDKGFIISDRDRQHIDPENLFNITILKNGIDLSVFERKDMVKTHDIVFVGNLGYTPNIEAVKIINILAKRRPEWKILVAGARSKSLSNLDLADNISMAGWVDDIRDAYCAGEIFLAPIHHGSGLQNKILEAMSLGIPCITTSFVNDAIKAIPGREIKIADSIEDMEQSVLDLLNNKVQMQDLAQEGFNFVTEHFSWEEKTRPLIDYIKNK